MLTVNQISCIRGGRCVFSGLGFEAAPGSITLLRGGNGSGKTSLIKLLATIMPADEGQVLWGNENAHESPDYLNQLIYIGHKNALKPELTVEENLLFWTKLEASDALLPAAFNYFKLEDKRHIPVSRLSAGWQRRAALAKLLCIPANVWLLDEPTAHLDNEGRELFYKLAKSRADNGGIIIMSTHEEDFIRPVATVNIGDFVPGDHS